MDKRVVESAKSAPLRGRALLPPNLPLLLAVFAISGAIVMAYAAFQTTRSASESVSLVAVQPDLDLGQIGQGIVTPHFDLVNTSSSPVVTLGVLTSCGCTDAKILAKEIKPSEHIGLSCRWDTRGRRGKTATSLAVIYKDTGSGQRDWCKLVARADIVPEFVYDPAELVFDADVPTAKTVTFCAVGKAVFTIKRAYCSQMAFAAELRKTTQEVVVRFNPARWEADPRFLHEEITIETNNLNEPVCRIPIRVVKASR